MRDSSRMSCRTELSVRSPPSAPKAIHLQAPIRSLAGYLIALRLLAFQSPRPTTG